MNVLIVEDDPMVGEINQKFALKLSFVSRCDRAGSLEEAKEFLVRDSYDLVLLDVYFPEGRGPELLAWIRKEEIPVHVIFITADGSRATVERAAHLGALDYLVKPFTFERFRSAMEEAERKMISLSGEDFSQESLDQIFRKGEAAVSSYKGDLDKGMSYKTYDIVREGIAAMNGAFTADQLAARLGMARVTVRRYLDFMEKQELLDVTLQYGKIGRPQHYYRRKGLL